MEESKRISQACGWQMCVKDNGFLRLLQLGGCLLQNASFLIPFKGFLHPGGQCGGWNGSSSGGAEEGKRTEKEMLT